MTLDLERHPRLKDGQIPSQAVGGQGSRPSSCFWKTLGCRAHVDRASGMIVGHQELEASVEMPSEAASTQAMLGASVEMPSDDVVPQAIVVAYVEMPSAAVEVECRASLASHRWAQ